MQINHPPPQHHLIGACFKPTDEAIRALFKNVPVPAFVWQKQGQDFIQVDYNDAAEEFTNGKAASLLGRRVDDLYPDMPEIKQQLWRCFTAGTSIEKQRLYQLQTADETRHLSQKYVFVPPDLVVVFSEDTILHKDREKKINDSENRYRELADLLPQTIYETDEAYNLTYANQAGFNAFGYTQQDLQAGLSVFELVIPEEREKVSQNIIKAIKGESSGGNEYMARRKDGSTFPASIYSLPIMRDGKVIGMRGIVADISRLKEAQIELQKANEELERHVRERTAKLAEANQNLQMEIAERELIEQILKQSEEKYRSVVKQSAESIFLIDLETRYLIEANPSFQKLLGYGRDEIPGLQMYDFIAHDRDSIDQNVNLIIKKGQHFIGERKYKKKCGTLVDVEVNASLITNKATRLLCVVVRDISARKQAEEELEKHRHHLEILVAERTEALSISNQKLNEELIERKRAEHALKLSKQRYELLYEENPSMYFTIDLKGKILSVNKFGAEQLGYSVEELIGKSVYAVIHKQDKTIVQQQLKDMNSSIKKIDSWEFRKVRKDGKIIWVKESARLIKDDNGKALILIVCDDITERIRAKNEKIDIMKKLTKTEKLAILGQMTAAIAHEINNPLDILQTKLYFLQKKLLDNCKNQDLWDDLTKIKLQINRLDQFSKKILNYAKPHAIKLQPVTIKQILDRSIELVKDSFREFITLEIVWDENIQLIQGDEIGLEIVFNNLILNALDSIHDSGKITITGRIFNDQMIEIKIQDTGVGITEADLQQIFDPFFTTKEKHNGTGLGLSLSKYIIEQHRGKIMVKSQPGAGTEFSIYLFMNPIS